MRSSVIAAFFAATAAVHAQAPDAAPLALLLPASTRAAALGNAWVAGRDEYVLFYNPAQLVASSGFGVSFGRYASGNTMATLATATTVGPVTLGWGVQAVEFRTQANASYPFTPDVLATRDAVEAHSFVVIAGGTMTWKGFRGGIAGKYAEDLVSAPPGSGDAGASGVRRGVFLADVGLGHALLGGTAALAVQNIGRGDKRPGTRIEPPLQTSLGWTIVRQAGQLDVGVAGQVTVRDKWVAPGAGVEVGYGWIEGLSVALRAGARRTETSAERPVGVGASITVDRFALDYALQSFDGGRTAHRVTLRWR